MKKVINIGLDEALLYDLDNYDKTRTTKTRDTR